MAISLRSTPCTSFLLQVTTMYHKLSTQRSFTTLLLQVGYSRSEPALQAYIGLSGHVLKVKFAVSGAYC